ncbi:MAG: hypothetical protein ACPGU7_13795 [Gammaproteobacteria bacterium]
MVISHRYRFIFVKTRKTAGTSIEVFLSGVCGAEDVFTPIMPPVPGHRSRNDGGFRNHMGVAALRDRVDPEVWDGYLSFCVERNPWDKTLSHYHWCRARSNADLTLDEYMLHNRPCTDFHRYADPDTGRIRVDRVVRYESLHEDLAEVFGVCGVPFMGDLGIRAKGDVRTDRGHYRDRFSAAQRRWVEKAFAREIACFGYRF